MKELFVMLINYQNVGLARIKMTRMNFNITRVLDCDILHCWGKVLEPL